MARGILTFQTRTVETLVPPLSLETYDVQDPWYEVDFDEHWTASFRLAIQHGRIVVSEVRIFPTEDRREPEMAYEAGKWSVEDLGPDVQVPPGGVTSQVVRKVPFDSLSTVSDIIEWVKANRPEEWTSLAPSGLTSERERRRPGPKGPTDEELVEYADQYLGLIREGITNPHTVLSRQHGHSTHHSKHLIDTARERSLLSSPESAVEKPGGRAGGMLTPNGEDILRRVKMGQRKEKQ